MRPDATLRALTVSIVNAAAYGRVSLNPGEITMRMMMKVEIPTQAGNKGIKDGGLPKAVMSFVDQYKPEGSFFTSENGNRTAFFFFDLKDPTSIPSVAEPFFMTLDARVTFLPVMNLEEMKAGVERAMRHT